MKGTKEQLCRCCGKSGHLKPSCWHLEHMCGICGKGGHTDEWCHHNPNRNQNKKKQNKNGPKPQPPPPPPPFAPTTPTTPTAALHSDDWFCKNPPCGRAQLAADKACKHCQTQRPKDVQVAVSPLTQKLGLTKTDQKLIGVQADGGVEEAKAQEADRNYLTDLRKTQETALEYQNPPPALKQQTEQRAAEIKKLEAKAATWQTKNTSDLAKSELTHEEKYQNIMKNLNEELLKAEDNIRMTTLNKKNRIEEEQLRSKMQLEKIEVTFKKYGEDTAGIRDKVKERIQEAQKVHTESMETLSNARANGTAPPGQVAEDGMVLVPVQKGTAIISPVQLNQDKINARLAAVVSQGGMLEGMNPNVVQYLADFMFAMVSEAAVLPEQNPTTTPQAAPPAPSAAGGTGTTPTGAAGGSNGTASPDQNMNTSQDDSGTGEADPKQRRRELTEEQAKKEEAEFERLQNGGS